MNKNATLFAKRTYLIVLLCWLVFSSSCKNRGSSGSHKSKKQFITKDSIGATTSTEVNYNIYIESSGSMDGYVTVGSDFKNAVLGLITDLKSREITDTISLYYINKDPCPQRLKALPEEIKLFIDALNPKSFQKSNCGRSTSYIPTIIKKVFNNTKTDINILVSDFIFSDSLGTSPLYLESAKNSVELFFTSELKDHDFSTIILKFNSQFNGIYYAESNHSKIDLTGKNVRRPYYMMIFGKQEKLQNFLSSIRFSDYAGFENVYYLLTPASSRPNAKLLRDNRKGTFDIKQPATALIINNARTSKNESKENVFQFSVAADLRFINIDETYLLNPDSYELPSNYKIVSISTNTDETNKGLAGYSHIFTMSTSDLKQNQLVSLKLKSKLPSWVGESSTIDDSNPQDPKQQKRSFGFSYLVEGIKEAYWDKYKGKEVFAIEVQVNKNEGNSSGAKSKIHWMIFMIIGVVVGVIIWLKNKK